MANIAAVFFKSAEYVSRGRSKEDYINDLYHCILFREPDPAGFSGGVALLNSTDFSSLPLIPETIASAEYAQRINPSLNFVDPPWDGIIDMATVVSAFADRHPNEGKKVTQWVNTGPSTAGFKDDYRSERRTGGSIIGIFQSYDGNFIYDLIYLTADAVGFHGSFPIYPGSQFSIWDSFGPLSRRFLTLNSVGDVFVTNFSTYCGNTSSPATTLCGSNNPVGNKVESFGMIDVGGNIGKRWSITLATDLSTQPGYTKEWVTLDLGPAPNVYDPEFSYLQYKQTHKQWAANPDDPNDYTYENFGDVVPYEHHYTFFDYFSI